MTQDHLTAILDEKEDVIEILKQKLRDVEEAVKNHSVLADFAYQGPPSKNWLKTEGRFWEGYNKRAHEVRKILASCIVDFHKPSNADKDNKKGGE